MAYSADQNAGGLDTLTNSTIATGDLIVLGDVSDSNRAKAITSDNLDTYLSQTAKPLTNKTIDLTNNTLTATSLQIKTAVTDETGSGALVFADSPVFTTPNIGSATGSISGNAATVTTNANLTGPITSVGNTTSIASQTGTGTKFVVDTSPTLVTPLLGTPTSGTLTNCTGLPIAGLVASTSTAIGVGSIELGHATDATISRVSAGVIAVEGVNVLTTAGGTLTGSITLGENTGIALDPAGSADGKWSGTTITGVSDYTQAFGDLVYLKASNSRWAATDADASATGGPVMIGMVVVTGTSGNACTILLNGQIRADAKFPALTIGAPVYLGETAGEIQVAIPTGADNVIRVVGFALTADEIYFNPSQDHQISVA